MTTPKGSLTLVGTGLRIAGQVTEEALSAIVEADKLFHLIQDQATHLWLEGRGHDLKGCDHTIAGAIRDFVDRVAMR